MNDKKPNVILIYPNQDYAAMAELHRAHRFPNINMRPRPMLNVGMLYIVAAIRDICNVQYIDNNIHKLSTADLVEYIEQQKPDIVGFGGTLTEWTQAKNIAIAIRESCPNTITAYGGPNASANPEKHVHYFDYVFRGWAEESFRQFILNYQQKKQLPNIDGVCFDPKFRHSGHVFIRHSATDIDVNQIRYPARNVVDLHSYKREQFPSVCKSPVDIVCASRGCPFSCKFCSSKSIWNQAYKMRDVYAVVEEVRMMQRLYGTKTVHFREDNLTANKTYLESICKGLEPLGIDWICQSRVNALDRDTIRMMKVTGCKVICCGFESANDETLAYIDKGFCFDDVVHTIDNLEREKMHYSGGFLVGVLNEGEEEIKRTLEFTRAVSQLNHSFVPRGAGRFVGWPTSETYKEIIDNGLVAYNWCDGEQLIPNTYKLIAKQVEDCMRRYW